MLDQLHTVSRDKALSLSPQEIAFLGVDLEKVHQKASMELDTLKHEVGKAGSFNEKENTRKNMKARILELKETEQPLHSTLSTLFQEFHGQLDEETLTVIRQFQELASPALIPDDTERQAVESLFYSNVGSDFSQNSFTSFVQVIYTQPDEVISKATKQAIEEKFQVPRNPIETGADLAKAIGETTPDGKPVYSSPETALEFRQGLKTYQEKGKPVLAIEGQSKAIPITLEPRVMENETLLTETANYALVRKLIPILHRKASYGIMDA